VSDVPTLTVQLWARAVLDAIGVAEAYTRALLETLTKESDATCAECTARAIVGAQPKPTALAFAEMRKSSTGQRVQGATAKLAPDHVGAGKAVTAVEVVVQPPPGTAGLHTAMLVDDAGAVVSAPFSFFV
jgi:hypothetical protein